MPPPSYSPAERRSLASNPARAPKLWCGKLRRGVQNRRWAARVGQSSRRPQSHRPRERSTLSRAATRRFRRAARRDSRVRSLGGEEEEELTSRTPCSEVCDKPKEGPSTSVCETTDSRLESPTLLAVSLRGGSGGRRGARSHLRPTSHAPGLTRLGSTYSFKRWIHVRTGSGGPASRSAAAAASPGLTGPRE